MPGVNCVETSQPPSHAAVDGILRERGYVDGFHGHAIGGLKSISVSPAALREKGA